MTIKTFQTALAVVEEDPTGTLYAYTRRQAPDDMLFAFFPKHQHVDIATAPDVQSYECLYHDGLWTAGGKMYQEQHAEE